MPNDPLYEQAASLIELRTQVSSLRVLLLHVLQSNHSTFRVDGLTPEAWLFQARKTALQNEVLKLSDQNVALASYVQQIVDDLD